MNGANISGKSGSRNGIFCFLRAPKGSCFDQGVVLKNVISQFPWLSWFLGAVFKSSSCGSHMVSVVLVVSSLKKRTTLPELTGSGLIFCKKGEDPHPQDKIQQLDLTKDPRPLYYKTPPCVFYHKNVRSKAVFGP